jgi:DNA-binding XRE family transcriptional regulator
MPYRQRLEPKALHPVFDQLRTLRIEQGLTQGEVGKRSGYSLDVIFKMETGKNLPRMKTFLDLCDFLNVDVQLVLRQKTERRVDRCLTY